MTFALITEGVSEHRIIKHIISKYFKDKEPEINQIQPKIVNDKQSVQGGWNEVLKYCQNDELHDIFIENDYLIIQIDTDQSPKIPFNIPHLKKDEQTGNQISKTVEELHNDVRIKLESLINSEIIEKQKDKIFFAICTHTIECWLLPIYYSNNHKSDINTCIGSLNSQLKKKNIQQLSSTGGKNTPQSIKTYDLILKNWKKRKDIDDSASHQYGFNYFLKSLRVLD